MLPDIFFTDDHRLRFAWTAVIFSAGIATGFLVIHFAAIPDGLRVMFIGSWTLVVSLMMLRYIEHRPIEMLGLRWNAFSARHCWGGFVLGAMMLNGAMIAAAVLGDADIMIMFVSWKISASILATEFVVFAFSALFEECIFRGYLFQVAIERIPVSLATILFSLVFAIAHLWNPHATAFAAINTLLAGLWLAGAFLRTRQLWLPIALHASWNYFQGTVWGVNVSGRNVEHPLLMTTLHGPDWLTGGAYGIEGGMLCTIVLVAGIIIVQTSRMFQISPEQFAVRHRVRYAEDHAIIHGTLE